MGEKPVPAGNPRGLNRRVWRSLLVPSFQRPPDPGYGSQRPEKITLVSRKEEAREPRDRSVRAATYRPTAQIARGRELQVEIFDLKRGQRDGRGRTLEHLLGPARFLMGLSS